MISFQDVLKNVFDSQFDVNKFIIRGLEREALRLDAVGNLASTKHPDVLGKSLCHPFITTDYSESLLELITPPSASIDTLFNHLNDLHVFTVKNIIPEVLWCSSMPCQIHDFTNVKLAEYGDSYQGRLKHLYRKGLQNRYGSAMQLISGLHFNTSYSDEFFSNLASKEGSNVPLQDFKNKIYFKLIRNFNKISWIVPYLFGSSVAFSKDFCDPSDYQHADFHESDCSIFIKESTSMRMSNLGYQSKEQANLDICFDDVDGYVKSLQDATKLKSESFSKIPMFDADNNYNQINRSVLQIENEFYSDIRPKSIKDPSGSMSSLLANGVNYIEVRNLDVNPYACFGVTAEQVKLLDLLLLSRALLPDSVSNIKEKNHNNQLVAWKGRQKDLLLSCFDKEVLLREWVQQIYKDCSDLAFVLDRDSKDKPYKQALRSLEPMFFDSKHVLSAKFEHDLVDFDYKYKDLVFSLSKSHNEFTKKLNYNHWNDSDLKSFFDSSVSDFNSYTSISDAEFNTKIQSYFYS